MVTVTDFVAADDDILVTPSNDGLNLAVTVNGTGLDDGVLDETSIESGFDMLTGNSGSDWFIINLDDKITDFKKNNKDGDLVTTV